jgi:chemotaxis protein histidine kinase CheA
MNDKNVIHIYVNETVELLEQLKEELELFYQFPQDRHLIQLMDDDLSALESKAHLCGITNVGMATHVLHHHFEDVMDEAQPVNLVSLSELLSEIDGVEKEVATLALAS